MSEVWANVCIAVGGGAFGAIVGAAVARFRGVWSASWYVMALLVRARGRVNLMRGRPAHRSGLTVPCRGGCGSTDPHDAHLARGAATFLGGPR